MAKKAFTSKTNETKKENPASCMHKVEHSPSGSSPVESILFLQRTIGNQAVQRFMKSGALRAKLRIGAPGDVYEQEADRVAEQVMRMPDPASIPQSPVNSQSEGLSIQSAGRDPENDIQRKEDDDEEEGIVHMKHGSQPCAAGSQQGVPPIVHEVLSSQGLPLDPATRAYMEPRFGHDFSRVRVHSGAAAEQSAKEVNANAYTVGHNIVFGAGRFTPGTLAGQRLLAHELTHIVQQEGSDQVCLAPVSNSAVQRQPAVQAQPTVSKYAAQDELLDWKEKADAFVDGTRGWMAANWTVYLGMTSSNPSLGWQESFIYGVASNTFGNAISDAARAAFNRILKKGAVKAGAAATGTAFGFGVGNVPGAVIGFVVGVLIESIAGLIFDAISSKKELGEVAAKSSRVTAQLVEAKTEGFETQGQLAKSELSMRFRIIQSRLTSTSDQAEVDNLEKGAKEEKELIQKPPELKDRSLYAEMIREWVLEHAGDEEDPSKATSATQWRFALEAAKNPKAISEERKVFGLPALPQALEAGKDLDNHPEIFAYQTRRHWSDAGLPLQDEAQKMVDKVPEVLAQGPQHPAAAVKAFFDGKTFTINQTRQPQLLIRLINKEDTDFVLIEEQKQHIESGQFILTCWLDLAEADGSVYVNKWKYVVWFLGPLPEHTCVVSFRSGNKLCGRPERKTSFSVSPD